MGNVRMPAGITAQIESRSTSYGRLVLQNGRHWLCFDDPVHVIVACDAQDVTDALRTIEHAVARHGLYAAGFMSYEASAAYGLAVHHADPDGLPLLWFGLYDRPYEIAPASPGNAAYHLGKWRANLDQEAYFTAIEQIKGHIFNADTYQVNFTMRLRSHFTGDAWALFHDLSQVQQAAHSAYLDLGRHVICSASPELFFQLDGDLLTARPMKGTAGRGRTLAEDKLQIGRLQSSVKDRAENVMIVDMIRNDFGRIAEIGTIQVPQLFTVERYPTLLQMTSTVKARSTAALPDIMAAMFPCASITGAPKVRTMQIIKALEPEPRGIYTGTIGYFGPERQASFNVAIRTIVIDRDTGQADYGVGSGIVWDSQAAEEYAECHLKSRVLVQRWPSFDLLESLLWTPEEGFFLLDLHLQRLAESAEYFGYPFEEKSIRRHLMGLSGTLTGPKKIRILLASDGELTSKVSSLAAGAKMEPVRVGLAAAPVNMDDIWLYHKTTHRRVYDEARESCPHCDEIILWNERGEITEASSANVVLELDGQLITPSVTSGLLAGTYRRSLLEQALIREDTITIADLQRSPQLFLINSVRKWRKAVLIESELFMTGG
jgi:para-aminobenzoate synthetase/4-amino-4-deoxychorismate lyase